MNGPESDRETRNKQITAEKTIEKHQKSKQKRPESDCETCEKQITAKKTVNNTQR